MPETVLLWEFKHDVRNCTASIRYNDRMVKLYYFETLVYTELHLPSETVYYRTNLRLMRKERAGAIQWTYDKRRGNIELGLRTLTFAQATKKNRQNSRSRRFQGSDNQEYKWRPTGPGERNLECLRVISNSQDILVAYWTFDDKTLRIPEAGEPIMDDLVTTFLLHFFRRCNRIDFLYPQTEPIPVIPVDPGDGSEETEYDDEDDDDGFPEVHNEQEEDEEEEEEDVHDDREP